MNWDIDVPPGPPPPHPIMIVQIKKTLKVLFFFLHKRSQIIEKMRELE